MTCRKCSVQLPENAVFCHLCGTKQSIAKKGRTRPNGAGYAKKRGSTWTAFYTLGWTVGEDNKMRQEAISKGGFTTKTAALAFIPVLKEAARFPKDRRQELLSRARDMDTITASIRFLASNQGLNPDSNLSFKEVYDRFIVHHEKRERAKTTMDGYKAAINHFKEIWGFRFLDLGVDDMQDCIDSCPRGRRTKENMKSLASMMYRYAGSRKLTTHNYAQYLYCGVDDTKTRPAFSMEQLELIRNAVGQYPLAEYVYVMCYTGFRPNEMLRLERSAYHMDKQGAWLVGGFKTEAGRDRIVPLSPKISGIVASQVIKAEPYIFPRPDGLLMDDAYFRQEIFYPLMAYLGIQPLPSEEHPPIYKPYSCRHTFSNLLKRVPGADTDKAALMGHADTSMTHEYQTPEIDTLRAISIAL